MLIFITAAYGGSLVYKTQISRHKFRTEYLNSFPSHIYYLLEPQAFIIERSMLYNFGRFKSCPVGNIQIFIVYYLTNLNAV